MRLLSSCYFLAGRSSKSNIQGSIRLKLWLSTREDRGLSEEEEMWNEMRQQEKIYSVFMEHQIKECEVSTTEISFYLRRSIEVHCNLFNFFSIFSSTSDIVLYSPNT